MKKPTLILFVLALIVSVFSVPAQAATKVGSACSTLNVKTVSNKVNLVCAKSGGKLQWIKSLDVSTYAIGPTGRMVYRYKSGKQERLSSANDWLKSDSRKSTSFDPIRSAAYKSIANIAMDKSASNVEFEYIIRPSFPKDIANAIKEQSKQVALRLSPVFDKKVKIKIILLTEKDKTFIDGDLKELVGNSDLTGALQILPDYVTKQRFYSRGGTGGGTAEFLPQLNFGYYVGHTSSLATLETYWPEVPPHELAHILQSVLSGGFAVNNGYGEGDPKAKWHGHLIEGSANSIGMALAFENLGWYSDEMDAILRYDISVAKSKYPMKTNADAVALMKDIERRDNDFRNSLSYSAGQIIWEYFIGTYGFDKFVELMKNVPLTDNFNENLKKTISLDREGFYAAAAPYLLATWKRLS
jgi:hypothetical protein